MTANQPSLFAVPSAPLLPQGFHYCGDAITAEDERHLLAEIAGLPFKEFQFHGFEGKRRVVSFGWRYDFTEHKALPADPIPHFLRDVCEKMQVATGFALRDLEQVLVTEYAPGTPIGWHKDRPVFDDVMGLSLASPCSFRLRRALGNGKWQRTSVRLESRSAYFLSGPVRWKWEHSIPLLESLRYSLTFRNLRAQDWSPNRSALPSVMNYWERNLGNAVVFLLPSLKLKEPSLKGPSIENRLHVFLMNNFGGYTAQAGNIFGYWREENGSDSYDPRRPVPAPEKNPKPSYAEPVGQQAAGVNKGATAIAGPYSALP